MICSSTPFKVSVACSPPTPALPSAAVPAAARAVSAAATATPRTACCSCSAPSSFSTRPTHDSASAGGAVSGCTGEAVTAGASPRRAAAAGAGFAPAASAGGTMASCGKLPRSSVSTPCSFASRAAPLAAWGAAPAAVPSALTLAPPGIAPLLSIEAARLLSACIALSNAPSLFKFKALP
ncbi:hypothetical protein D3C78_1348670 [compost metagenome]